MNTNKSKLWGVILSGFVTMALVGSAGAKMAHVPKMYDGLIHAGIPAAAILPIALLELICLALFLIPRTTVLGALLLTGYFGGATLTHIIGGETIVPPLFIGLVIWIGAWFRVPELRDLLPLKRSGIAMDVLGDPQPSPTRG
jgi:hypothetical protein